MKTLRIDIWSDIACPWCHVGKRRLEAALADFPRKDAVEIVWRAFELDPSAPRERDRDVSYAERIAKKYGSSPKEAEAMITRMTDVAREDGLDFHFERIRPGNTFDAHRVLHLALVRGGWRVQDAVKERFLRGYLTDGEPIGDPETLVRLAADAGLDAEEVRATLASDQYTADVRADEEEARELGINGVPFFVLGGKLAVSGAQPSTLLLRALDQAAKELDPRPVMLAGSAEEGAFCGPDGCA